MAEKRIDSDFLEEETLNLAMLATDRQLNASRNQAAIRNLQNMGGPGAPKLPGMGGGGLPGLGGSGLPGLGGDKKK